jgi:hypothetical protein
MQTLAGTLPKSVVVRELEQILQQFALGWREMVAVMASHTSVMACATTYNFNLSSFL